MIDIWLLGNTGVRNPLRIQEALRVYSESNLVGQIRGVSGSVAFMNLLHEKGVLNNQAGRDASGSYGRKWRLVFNQNGFTYDEDGIGNVDHLTSFGESFLRASTIPAMQECFLRSTSMMMEPLSDGKFFSKLRWTLAVMLSVEERTGSSSINFIEFSTQVQTTNPSHNINDVVSSLLHLRADREASNAKMIFDRDYYNSLQPRYEHNVSNFREYGDMNLRYLRATGIVKSKGKGIEIVPEKHELAKLLASDQITDKSDLDRKKELYAIPSLPTDEETVAREVLSGLESRLKSKKIPYTIDHSKLISSVDVNNARLHLEELLSQNAEELYAQDQKNKWFEISEYMDLIIKHKRSKVIDDETEIKVPKEEASAYLEWCLWRAFLAMNALNNKPYNVRRFKVDQDFFPVGTAPGNGPDLIAEYGDCTVVIEVTLSDGSRQEAMEGEPVRRHVSDIQAKIQKPTYGLFIANHVDTNTAETFRVGTWYTREDVRTRLDILPLTLSQFKDLFDAYFSSPDDNKRKIVDVIKCCMIHRDSCEAPRWKEEIANDVSRSILQNLTR